MATKSKSKPTKLKTKKKTSPVNKKKAVSRALKPVKGKLKGKKGKPPKTGDREQGTILTMKPTILGGGTVKGATGLMLICGTTDVIMPFIDPCESKIPLLREGSVWSGERIPVTATATCREGSDPTSVNTFVLTDLTPMRSCP